MKSQFTEFAVNPVGRVGSAKGSIKTNGLIFG